MGIGDRLISDRCVNINLEIIPQFRLSGRYLIHLLSKLFAVCMHRNIDNILFVFSTHALGLILTLLVFVVYLPLFQDLKLRRFTQIMFVAAQTPFSEDHQPLLWR